MGGLWWAQMVTSCSWAKTARHSSMAVSATTCIRSLLQRCLLPVNAIFVTPCTCVACCCGSAACCGCCCVTLCLGYCLLNASQHVQSKTVTQHQVTIVPVAAAADGRPALAADGRPSQVACSKSQAVFSARGKLLVVSPATHCNTLHPTVASCSIQCF
jgi:hypothetical protein